MTLVSYTEASVRGDGHVARRDFLKAISGAAAASGALHWTDLLSVQADELRKRNKACILLWMQGGPSQFETFSPKPGHANGGPTQAIATNVPGIEISENLPETAKLMDRLAVIRSLTSKEGNHQRASFLVHTGYAPTASVKHPTLGSNVARELADPTFDLPSFVRIGNNFRNSGGAGLLGVDWDAFQLGNPEQLPANTQTATSPDRYRRRLGLLDRLEGDYAASEGKQEVEDHKKLYAKSSRLILSPRMEAFDVSKEPESVRDAYGRKPFGTSCLLARRLIETGVTFVEISLGNWDTHNDNFNQVKRMCDQLDGPMATLIRDLEQRGLWDSTMVVWMGEFGRTPRINGRSGRDHYPKAYNAVIGGAGLRGGQVIGRTDDGGVDVAERPVAIQDLLQSICRGLGVNADKENMSAIGRPIKIVDGGQPIEELFG